MKPYEAWLIKADHDLLSAQKLAEGDSPILDTAVYHAQQCAEKALKAYLAYKQQPVQRTHDVALLVELCCAFDENFKALLDDAKELTPYSTAFRYPDLMADPEESDVIDAIQKAANILNFVKGKLS